MQTIPAWEEDDYGTGQLGKIGGFSLHAGVAVNTRERKKLERISRYISRPALSEARLELTDQGMVSYALKTAYRDGTTHVVFERAPHENGSGSSSPYKSTALLKLSHYSTNELSGNYFTDRQTKGRFTRERCIDF